MDCEEELLIFLNKFQDIRDLASLTRCLNENPIDMSVASNVLPILGWQFLNDESHNHYLALDICRGKRPKIRDETPENKKIRKQIEELRELKELTHYFTPIIKSTTKTQLYETHTQAIYTSWLLNLLNLPEPVSCLKSERIYIFKKYSRNFTENFQHFGKTFTKLSILLAQLPGQWPPVDTPPPPVASWTAFVDQTPHEINNTNFTIVAY
ncbi:hypothetical protein C1645_832021 [Glomus cerebriforme]|uniref:Uncharacterized protein n=1 Tax=Glomus cerebriforme TaxID=658196 RepID=A0A397SIX9_9GLOM|nr:hypothetical protein C1645_832021 [Glomus cerebriforme]